MPPPAILCAFQDRFSDLPFGAALLRGKSSDIADSLFRRKLLQVSDHIGALVGFLQVEVHIGIRDELVWIGKPLVETGIVPSDSRFCERVGVLEALHVARFSAVNTAKTRSFFVVVERVAPAAASIE